MRVVDRKEFLSLPEGILYSKYAPCYTEGLEVKGQTSEIDGKMVDWCHLSLELNFEGGFEDGAIELDNGKDLPFDTEGYGRDGCFDEDQLFLIWSEEDKKKLITVLEKSLGR